MHRLVLEHGEHLLGPLLGVEADGGREGVGSGQPVSRAHGGLQAEGLRVDVGVVVTVGLEIDVISEFSNN